MIFSDRFRTAKILAGIGVILGLGAYYAYVAANLEAGWRWCLEDPAARDGALLVFPLWTVTAVDGPDAYRISKIIKDIPVHGDTRPLHEGDTVSVLGHFDARRVVVEEDVREIHTLRRWKEGLGVLGFLFVVGAAPFVFRIRDGRVQERPWRT